MCASGARSLAAGALCLPALSELAWPLLQQLPVPPEAQVPRGTSLRSHVPEVSAAVWTLELISPSR